MAKEKRGFLREGQDGGDKYRIKHELITHYKLRSVGSGNHEGRSTPQDVCKRRDYNRGIKSSCGSAVCLSPWEGFGEGGGGCCPPRRAARTQWGRLHCLRLLSPPPAALPLEKQL